MYSEQGGSTGLAAGRCLSCQATVTVLVERIPKDVTEAGLNHLITHFGFHGTVLNTRFLPRTNKAFLTVASISDARLLVDSLLDNQFIGNLAPTILGEKRVTVTVSPSTEAKSKPKFQTVSMSTPQKQISEVFMLNKPFQVESQRRVQEPRAYSSASLSSDSVQKKPKVSGQVPIGKQVKELKELQLNQPSPVDDETFKYRFIEKTEKQKKFLEKMAGKAECEREGTEAGDLTSSSEDTEPPFYRLDDDNWEREERVAPVTASVTDQENNLGLSNNQTSARRDTAVNPEDDDELSVLLNKMNKKNKKTNEKLEKENENISRNYSRFGELVDDKLGWEKNIDANKASGGENNQLKLPETWTEVELIDIFLGETYLDLPTFIVYSSVVKSCFDVTLDPQQFELDSPWTETLQTEMLENLTGKLFVRRVGWMGEEELNVVEMRREEEDSLCMGSVLSRLSLLRKKTDDPHTESHENSNKADEDLDISPHQISANVVLQTGSFVYWEGFGKSSNFAKLYFEDKDRELLDGVMLETDYTKTIAPEPGQIVAINIQSEDSANGSQSLYLRAEIVKVSQRKRQALCELVDHRGRHIVTFPDIHPLPQAARLIPPLCLELQLHQVPLIPRDEAKKMLRPFKEIIVNKEFILRIRNEQKKIVELIGKDGCSFNELLSEILRGEHDHKKTMNGEEEKKISKAAIDEEDNGNISHQKANEEEEGRELSKSSSQREEKKAEVALIGGENSLNVGSFTSYRTLQLGTRISVRVLHFNSMTNFFVCGEAEYHQLENFQVRLQNMAEIVGKAPMTFEDLRMGDLVMFKSGLDWYRAIVVKLKNEKAKVFCPDWGWSSKSVRVSQDNFQPVLQHEIRRTKFWASPCSQDRGEGGVKEAGDILNVSVVRVEGIKYIMENI